MGLTDLGCCDEQTQNVNSSENGFGNGLVNSTENATIAHSSTNIENNSETAVMWNTTPNKTETLGNTTIAPSEDEVFGGNVEEDAIDCGFVVCTNGQLCCDEAFGLCRDPGQCAVDINGTPKPSDNATTIIPTLNPTKTPTNPQKAVLTSKKLLHTDPPGCCDHILANGWTDGWGVGGLFCDSSGENCCNLCNSRQATIEEDAVPCGPSFCSNGQICCDESCGTCIIPGMPCPALGCVTFTLNQEEDITDDPTQDIWEGECLGVAI